jgi:hypothetical protein
MYTRSAWPRVSKHGKLLYGFSEIGTTYGSAALIRWQDSKVETLKLQFDLAALAQVQAQSIEPDPTPWEALTFWKDLLTRSKHEQMATMHPEAAT